MLKLERCCLTEVPELPPNLLSLSLANNRIAQADPIFPLLASQKLIFLDLQWNNLAQRAATSLFQELQDNESLERLNLAYNCIVSGPMQPNRCVRYKDILAPKSQFKCKEVVWVLREMLEYNTSLLHLDLSQNMLSYQELMVVEDGMRKN